MTNRFHQWPFCRIKSDHQVLARTFLVVKAQCQVPMAYPAQFYEYRLTMEEDPGLRTNQHYANAVNTVINRPPGVTSLREWGEMRIPSGKYQGKTYEEAAQDYGYVNQIWNRRAVSGWLRSLQMYFRARRQAEADWEKRQQPVIQPKAKALSSAPPMSTPIDEAPWVKVNMSPRASTSQMTPPSSEKSKKRQPESSQTKPASMTVEADPDRIQQLQTQIAVLQRELARATAIEDRRPEGQ